jgi:Ca2+-binding RTX toxin-like protein
MPGMKLSLAVLLTLVLAAPASATTVTGGSPLAITDDVGEVNALTVATTDAGVRIADTSAELISTAQGCTAESAHVVNCVGTFGTLSANLGEENDQLTVTGTFLTLELAAGDGNDSVDITGAKPFARDASFTVSGNDGDDELRGSDADESFSGGPGSDAIHGGGGLDEADYSDHAEDIVVDLRHEGGQGADGEGDLLDSIESVFGGLGDDVLIGNAGFNALRGNEGRDRLRGGPGVDSLDGDGEVDDDLSDAPPLGHDDVRAGAGDDVVFVGPHSVARGDKGDDSLTGTRSRLFGGGGEDFITGDRGRTSCGGGDLDTASISSLPNFIGPDCERVAVGVPTQLYVDNLSRRVRLTCVGKPRGCSGRIRVGTAHARFRLQPGQPERVRLRGPLPRGRVGVTLDGIAGVDPVSYVTRI